MRWKHLGGRLAVGLGVMTIATSFAIVPPTALPSLLSEVDRPQQIGIALLYGFLVIAVVIYAWLDSREESGASRTHH